MQGNRTLQLELMPARPHSGIRAFLIGPFQSWRYRLPQSLTTFNSRANGRATCFRRSFVPLPQLNAVNDGTPVWRPIQATSFILSFRTDLFLKRRFIFSQLHNFTLKFLWNSLGTDMKHFP